MNGGDVLDLGTRWAVLHGVADILATLAFLTLFVALALVAARRDTVKHRRTPILFATFFLFLGVSRVLVWTGQARLQSWWNLTSAVISVLTAGFIVANLPRYLRLPKV